MTRNIIDIDLGSCIGCHSCAVVCKQENNVGLGTYYNKVLTVGPFGTYPDLEMYYLPVACQHCDNPECVSVCPTGASYRREDGVVLVDHSKCIGCQYCVMACPYGVRAYDEGRDKGVIEKCTMCAHLIDKGENEFVEIGYGGVLFTMMKRISKEVDRVRVGTREQFDEYVSTL